MSVANKIIFSDFGTRIVNKKNFYNDLSSSLELNFASDKLQQGSNLMQRSIRRNEVGLVQLIRSVMFYCGFKGITRNIDIKVLDEIKMQLDNAHNKY